MQSDQKFETLNFFLRVIVQPKSTAIPAPRHPPDMWCNGIGT